MAVLGSGGHTAEMISLLRTLDSSVYAPMIYVIATTDSTSLQRLEEFERDRASLALKLQQPFQKGSILRVLRSREVGQSYLTSAFTTMLAMLHAAILMLSALPTLVICNGPGTCVPICIGALLVRTA